MLHTSPSTRQEVVREMCRAVKCRTCGKTTWAGCGQHVEQVLRGVPESKRCAGHPKLPGERRSLVKRLFSRA